MPLGAINLAHTAALSSLPALHVAEDSLQLIAASSSRLTDLFGQLEPGGGEEGSNNIRSSLIKDPHT